MPTFSPPSLLSLHPPIPHLEDLRVSIDAGLRLVRPQVDEAAAPPQGEGFSAAAQGGTGQRIATGFHLHRDGCVCGGRDASVEEDMIWVGVCGGGHDTREGDAGVQGNKGERGVESHWEDDTGSQEEVCL